ncbi:MAG: hypothetical protein R3254_06910, partial [Thiomicrorhabdus sp.]|nr:hypothetical protein [Thiomicrorhabdus sp.]
MNKKKTARIILLNGASSSGKSTLAKQLQKDSCEPFWHWSFDHLRDQTILPMERFRSNEFSWEVQREAIFDGFHRSIAAFASSGNNLIIEHIIENRIWHLQLQELLKPFNLLFVGLHCPLDTLKT